MKLLIVEDEEKLSKSMSDYLSKESFLCESAYTSSQAQDLLAMYNYDCVILDLTLPDGSGLTLLESLKVNNKLEGVIIVSAKNSLHDRLHGLDMGADDYLIKPFHMSELRARIVSIIRRKNFLGSNHIRINELYIDLQSKTVQISGVELSTTRKEFDLLLFLAANRNRVVSKRAIAEHLSGEYAEVSNNFDFVYTHMKNLKKKLSEAGCNYIKTIHGLGYKMEG